MPYPATTATAVLALLFAFKDGFAGMSPGKWVLGLRVVDRATLRPIGPLGSFMRNLLPALPLIGFVFAAFIGYQILGSGERLGDSWAGTRVVLRKHAHKPPFHPGPIACERCGYDLTGNVSGQCPECGTAIPEHLRWDLPEAR